MLKILTLVLLVFICSCAQAYCRNIEAVKLHFLKGDYKAAILEGEKILAGSKEQAGCDELYYFLGLSYFKDGNYLRSSDIFEIIINEFPQSRFREEALLGLGDVYAKMGNYTKAKEAYNGLLDKKASSKNKASLYYRLSQVGLKEGDNALARDYLDKLKREYPFSPEAKADSEILSSPEIYYTVQVGSFSSSANAGNLMQKLIREGYPAYTEEFLSQEAKAGYRVRVGKFSRRSEARELEARLSQAGYPTRIFP